MYVTTRGAEADCSLLDDHELQALGVTWEDYVLVAAELGMDVLRYVTQFSPRAKLFTFRTDYLYQKASLPTTLPRWTRI